MAEYELTSAELSELKKELKKENINYDETDEYTKKYLRAAYLYANLTTEKLKEEITKITKHKLSIEDFCENANIWKTALYSKVNGKARHKPVITYINGKSKEFEMYKNSRLRKYIQETNVDHKLMAQLLKHDVEYMALKQQNIDLQAKVKELEKKYIFLENQLSSRNYS